MTAEASKATPARRRDRALRRINTNLYNHAKDDVLLEDVELVQFRSMQPDEPAAPALQEE